MYLIPLRIETEVPKHVWITEACTTTATADEDECCFGSANTSHLCGADTLPIYRRRVLFMTFGNRTTTDGCQKGHFLEAV